MIILLAVAMFISGFLLGQARAYHQEAEWIRALNDEMKDSR